MNDIECTNVISKYLYNRYHTNPVNKGIIEITGYSDNEIQNSIHHKNEYNWSEDWGSEYTENSYVQTNFKNILLNIYR